MTKHTAGQGSKRTREERKREILEVLKSFPELSSVGVARVLKMSPSPHVRGLLKEMYDEGLIDAYRYEKPNGMPCYMWFRFDRADFVQNYIPF